MQYSHHKPDEFIIYLMDLLKEKRIIAKFSGFTESEIQEVKDAQQVDKLPKLFEAYLKHMGHMGFKSVFLGSDFGLYSMEGDKEAMQSNIEYRNTIYEKAIELPENIFVFMSHQGHSYMFFESNDVDSDPPVYMYTESEFKIEKISNSLSEFFVNRINNYAQRRDFALGKHKADNRNKK